MCIMHKEKQKLLKMSPKSELLHNIGKNVKMRCNLSQLKIVLFVEGPKTPEAAAA